MHTLASTMAMAVHNAISLDQILEASRVSPQRLFVLNFWATWVNTCHHMNEVFSTLASTYPAVSFWDVDVDAIGDVTMHFCVEAVPTFVFLKKGEEIRRISGADPEELANSVNELQEDSQEHLDRTLAALIKRHPFMVFIKGTPMAPRCGFTRQLIALLEERRINYDYFDILEDERVRQGLKIYSDWPTYPQIYMDGELIGGLDIFKEMDASLLERHIK